MEHLQIFVYLDVPLADRSQPEYRAETKQHKSHNHDKLDSKVVCVIKKQQLHL